MAARTARKASDDDRTGDHLRLCAVTRTERPVADLIRFVAAPDGSMTPDLARRLPGRGVWITADRQTLDAAVKGKAFARSLKRAVNVPDELTLGVEALMVKRACEALALCNKAGAALSGFDKVHEAIGRGEVSVLLHGQDAAADGRGKLDRKFLAVQGDRRERGEIVDELTIEQLSLAMGRSNVVHAALIYGGATDKFAIEAERLKRFRHGVVSPVCTSMNATHALTDRVETDIA